MTNYGPEVLRFVDPEGAERLNLNNLTGWMVGRGLDVGIKPRARTFLSSPTIDGATLVNHSLQNSKIAMPLYLMRSGADPFYHMQLLERELSRGSNTIEFRPRGAGFTFLMDTYPADIPAMHQGLAAPSAYVLGQSGATLMVEIERAPHMRLLDGGKNAYLGGVAGFEDADYTAAGTVAPTVTQDETVFLYGTQSLKVQFTSTGGSGFTHSNVRLASSVSLTSGDDTKVFSVWTYQLPTNVTLAVRTNGGTNVADMVQVADLWNGWKRYAYTHTATTNSFSIYAFKSTTAVATAYFDGIQVETPPITGWAPSQTSLTGAQI